MKAKGGDKMVKRKIVKIDENLCNGCGKCVSPCAEKAIHIINGKAKVIREELCDGAGFCLGTCPTGALSIEERETARFDEKAVEEHVEKLKQKEAGQEIILQCSNCGKTEYDSALFAVRMQGTSKWVCARCLPSLIHG